MTPLRKSSVLGERRHHVRHRLTSIVYAELGPGNGGIIVNLGTGGLTLHAASKLNAETELTVRFRLQSTEPPIEAAGRVTWLGPTRKEAGISFQNLPREAEQRIANWIAAQEQPVSVTQREIEPQPKSPPMNEGARQLFIQAPAAASLPTETFENAQSSLSMGIPRRVVSESFQPDEFSNTASGFQRATSPSPAIAFATPEERVERPSDKFLRLPPRNVTKFFPSPRSRRRPRKRSLQEIPDYRA